jgi:hypothetical protein
MSSARTEGLLPKKAKMSAFAAPTPKSDVLMPERSYLLLADGIF